ncbi:MAG: hypothetical protein ACK45R_05830, partial [Candidatus Kapaibacterium sp.]
FHYCFNNPIMMRDPFGLEPDGQSTKRGSVFSKKTDDDAPDAGITDEVVCEAEGPWSHWWSAIDGSRRGNEWMAGAGAARMGEPTAADKVLMKKDIENLKFGLEVFGATNGLLQRLSASKGQWLGKNGRYYASSWGGNQHTGSRTGALKNARFYGKVARYTAYTSLGLGAIEVRLGYSEDGKQIGYNTQRAIASTAGGWAGAELGALIGGGIGAGFAGLGAIPGSAIGAFIGGIGLGYLGSSIGETAVDKYHGK